MFTFLNDGICIRLYIGNFRQLLIECESWELSNTSTSIILPTKLSIQTWICSYVMLGSHHGRRVSKFTFRPLVFSLPPTSLNGINIQSALDFAAFKHVVNISIPSCRTHFSSKTINHNEYASLFYMNQYLHFLLTQKMTWDCRVISRIFLHILKFIFKTNDFFIHFSTDVACLNTSSHWLIVHHRFVSVVWPGRLINPSAVWQH